MVFRRGGLFDPAGQLRSELDLWTSPRFNGGRPYPAVNVWDGGEDNLFAEAEIPGLKNEDLEISIVGSELTIKGQRRDAAEDGKTFHRRERGVGSFARVIRLPVVVDAARVRATLHDGVLSITLPKHDSAKPRKIDVTAKPQ